MQLEVLVQTMKPTFRTSRWAALAAGLLISVSAVRSQDNSKIPSSYMPVDIHESFSTIMNRMTAAKPEIMKRHMALLEQRYDLSNRPAQGVKMSGGKAVQQGVRIRLASGTTWDQLSKLSPEQIKERNLFPAGFLPLPHPNHPEGGMLFPKFEIDEIKKQEGRDLTRFDLDFDFPDHLIPEFPPPIYLTTRVDLGDVSHGKLVTMDNYYELFNGILNPKQLEGLRLLLTTFAQQQFNATEDRRSQRALKTIEDFTEFEQRAAYFDGDPVIAQKKGVNVLDRGSQVHAMAEFQAILDFPPAPKLGVDGKLNPKKADAAEMRGQQLFFGKARCVECHQAPYYTDNLMHNLQTERFFESHLVNGMMAYGDGPIKTFPLRGAKDSPPYLHDGRLLTLEDTVEFFTLVLELQVAQSEKADLVAFLRVL